jgi:hypothetical protein
MMQPRDLETNIPKGTVPGMTATEQGILEALREIETAVANLSKTTEKPDFLSLFARVDALKHQLPSNTDPSLLHYLQKQSWQKARLFLESRLDEIPPGACAHVE